MSRKGKKLKFYFKNLYTLILIFYEKKTFIKNIYMIYVIFLIHFWIRFIKFSKFENKS